MLNKIKKTIFYLIFWTSLSGLFALSLNTFLKSIPINTGINPNSKLELILCFSLILILVVSRIIQKKWIQENKSSQQISKLNHKGKTLQVIFSLLLIACIFTAIKLPYFDLPFSGDFTVKYASHTEPALHMAQENNFLLYKQRYMADPILNPDGTRPYIANLPLVEWGLALGFKAFPQIPIEIVTRGFMHLLWLAILLVSFFLFRRWVSTSQSLLIVALLALNPISIYGSFITVYDTLTLLFFLLILFFLSKGILRNKVSYFVWAGLLLGIGTQCKISLVVFLFPSAILLLFLNKKSFRFFVFNLIIFFTTGLGSFYFIGKTVAKMNHNLVSSLLIIVAGLVIATLLSILLSKTQPKILGQLANVPKYVVALSSTLILTGALVIAFVFGKAHVLHFSQEFLTDSSLIFNFDFYNHLIFFQLKDYATALIFVLAPFGFLLALLSKKKRIASLVLSLSLGAGMYLIVASKPIFIHNYYTQVIMLVLVFLASISIVFITSTRNPYLRNGLIAIFIIIAFLFSCP
ncbi:glycosyltransferase family 39 protein, partial [Patescibacteria group bacterium]|nr:glycosyltransferase family 39 protein [Patescibacteria group bacterium]